MEAAPDVASPLLLEGLGIAQPCWAALADREDDSRRAAAAAAESIPAAASSAAAAAGPYSWLGALRHLELPGQLLGLLGAWVCQLEGAPQLTALHVCPAFHIEGNLNSLVACTGLQELVVDASPLGGDVQLPEGFTKLTALTKVELLACGLSEVPEVVLGLPQLRHLSLNANAYLGHIPDDISRLAQLQQLDISGTGVEELPEELGFWLPQLEGLNIDGVQVVVPQSVTRLSSLSASGSGITQVSAVSHLVRLKSLDMRSRLQPPFQALSQLSSMETLTIGWDWELSVESVQQVAIPGPMPALRSLTLSGDGDALVPVTQLQVLMGAQQLTYLNLQRCVHPEHLPALGQLPQLRTLFMGVGRGVPWAGSLPWLQQQPRLTFLGIYGCAVEGWQLEQLPAQLEELHLSWCTLEGEQPRELTQLSRLRNLRLPFTGGLEQLPPWLASLRSLEELNVTGCMVTNWEALAQLPLLRRVRGCELIDAQAFRDAPHLCWTVVHCPAVEAQRIKRRGLWDCVVGWVQGWKRR